MSFLADTGACKGDEERKVKDVMDPHSDRARSGSDRTAPIIEQADRVAKQERRSITVASMFNNRRASEKLDVHGFDRK